jgi:hypothetical protein
MNKISLKDLFIFMALAVAGFCPVLYAEDLISEGEKTLDLTGILRTSYSLGGDTGSVKAAGEAIYLAQGSTNKALAALKDILIEHKPAERPLNSNEETDIIIFRGILTTLCKIELTKVISKDNFFEVYAEYLDITGLDTPSQAAVIIPVGKLPIGKYSVVLYAGGELRKKAEFTVRRAPFFIDLRKKR